MYNSFFNFRANPFKLTPDPEFLFLSKIHRKALMYIKYGISSDSGGFILLTGDVGAGKTTIIRTILRELDKDTVSSRINNTRLTSEQLMAMINDDFGLDTYGKDKIQMLKDLTSFLIDQFSKNKKSILIIDEAQNLSSEHLEEIRLLSNLETDTAKLLQIILIGQPELRSILNRTNLRALRQRITVSCHISPLKREETEPYIVHRLDVAGNRSAVVFENGTIDLIYNFSRGIPRLINIVCDFILLAAFSDQRKEISIEMVQDVINDLEHDNRYWRNHREEKNSGKNIVPFADKSLEKREERHNKSDNSDQDNINKEAEIFHRITEMVKKCDNAIDHLKHELINSIRMPAQMEISDIKKEIELLKRLISLRDRKEENIDQIRGLKK